MSQVISEHRIRYYFAIFELRGNRVAWVTSPTDTFKAGSGGKRSISVTLSPLLLGGGNYILSVSIFDAIKENRVSAASRHDLLARCFDFKVVENDGRQSPMFHHPAQDRKSVVSGKSVSVRVDLGGRRIIKKKNKKKK